MPITKYMKIKEANSTKIGVIIKLKGDLQNDLKIKYPTTPNIADKSGKATTISKINNPNPSPSLLIVF